ncbi:MAG: flagellar biosynthetic protein FliO [Clostridiaceae bacterium]|nr:flagellar biosynthetic protein FliO [Clostridiaceae bacterium]
MDNWAELLGMLLVTVLVLAATFYTTKFVARRSQIGGKGRHMQILERLPLGKDKFLAIIEVGGQYMLVGISGQNINLISVLPDTFTGPDPVRQRQSPLNNPFQAMMEQLLQKSGRNGSAEKNEDDSGPDQNPGGSGGGGSN